MKPEKTNKLGEELLELSPASLGLIGALLLICPDVCELLGKTVDKQTSTNMFIASLVLLAYSGIAGSILLRSKRKDLLSQQLKNKQR